MAGISHIGHKRFLRQHFEIVITEKKKHLGRTSFLRQAVGVTRIQLKLNLYCFQRDQIFPERTVVIARTFYHE